MVQHLARAPAHAQGGPAPCARLAAGLLAMLLAGLLGAGWELHAVVCLDVPAVPACSMGLGTSMVVSGRGPRLCHTQVSETAVGTKKVTSPKESGPVLDVTSWCLACLELKGLCKWLLGQVRQGTAYMEHVHPQGCLLLGFTAGSCF